ncbi:MAG TPA: signal recognition particle protein Srp19 [Candidatus Poseidoniales archaeon]|jgi:signal recognition particle subunit SEC65|nr:signal recognition particle protein Srp19 [Candidatus Poseidoniales archaeon]
MGDRRPLVIYPEYFDSRLARSAGRRLPVAECVKSPTTEELATLAKGMGLAPTAEEASHPAHWAAGRGRLRLAYGGAKAELLHQLGAKLKAARRTD